MRLSRSLVLLLAAAACGMPTVPPPSGEAVGEWIRAQLIIVRAERLNAPLATRIAAYAAVALHEGLAAGEGSGLRSLAGRVNGMSALPTAPGPVDGGAAMAAAARTVLGTMVQAGFPTTRRLVDSLAEAQVAARRAAGVASDVLERSEARGAAIGEAVLAWAAQDGFDATRGKPYALPTGRGVWVNTSTPDQHLPEVLSGASDMVLRGNAGVALDPTRASTRELHANRPKVRAPGPLAALDPSRPTEPYWGTLRPFVLQSADECPIVPPPAYDERPGSAFHAMVREVVDSTRALGEEQRRIALFWADNAAMTGTPSFHWMSILLQMIPRRALTAEQAAHVLALTSLSIADAFIATWAEKYRSLTPRPVTVIRRLFDPSFQTVVITPPFPEYPSGHSTQSGAAARVLATLLGDTLAFEDATQVDIGYAPRAFRSFSHARDEVAISRLYGGIHFMPAIREGVVMGECIAGRALERLGAR